MAGLIEPVDSRLPDYPALVLPSANRAMIRLLSSRGFLYFSCILLVLLESACSSFGPKAITRGRQAYTEAMAVTNDQQILGFIVRLRYAQAGGLLGVTSITANFNVSANASANLPAGQKESYAQNLVPLGLGFAYEENPTISYTPIQGDKYLRRLLSPIPLDVAVLFQNTSYPLGEVMTTLIRSINGLKNPDFLTAPSVRPDPRFARVVELLDELQAAGHLDWVQAEKQPGRFALALIGYAPDYTDQVRELSGLLGFPASKNPTADLVIPVRAGLGGGHSGELALRTRSVYDLMRVAAAAIDVPEQHLASGTAERFPPAGPVGADIRIGRSKERPANAAVAVAHQGWWFYVDNTDPSSKHFFRLIELLMSSHIADVSDRQQLAPVITLPASR